MAEIASVSAQIDLENWMSKLPARLRDMSVIYLSIPGSHDSMSYGITRSSQLAPDAEPVLANLYPLFRGTIMRWTITQSADTIQQLKMGIRYFDLRLATKNGDNKFYFTHGLYAEEITKALTDVRDFVESHPGEIVILDFQHFYGFAAEDHRNLMDAILNMYGLKLCPRRLDLQLITLNSMKNLNQQIIVVYRHQAVYGTHEFWQPQMMPSPWPKEKRPGALLDFFNQLRRHPGTGFVHQAVLTPSASFIVLRWLSNLRDKCAKPVLNDVIPKMDEFSPGRPPGDAAKATVNVVIADFVEMENAIFPRTIIELNLKLLRNTDVLSYRGY